MIMGKLTEIEIDRIVEMAWEDRTPFEAIAHQFGLSEQAVIQLMRQQMKASSFKRWRRRVQGRSTKHRHLRQDSTQRFKCTRQKSISFNAVT